MNAPASPEPADTPSPQPASLTARLAAKLIDLTITAAIAFAALLTNALLFLRFGQPEFVTMSDILRVDPIADREAHLAAAPLLAVPTYEAAMIAMTAWKGMTPGDSQRRGWHDKAAGTIVVNVPATAPQGHYLLAKWQRKWQRRLDRSFG